MALNKWSTVFAETVGFVFVYNKSSGIHPPQTLFLTPCQENNSEGVAGIIQYFLVFTFWIKSIVDFDNKVFNLLKMFNLCMDTKFCWFVMFAKDRIIIIIA